MNRLSASLRVREYVRKHRPDYQIVLFMGILMLLGLIVLYAISPARIESLGEGASGLDSAHFMQRQLLYLAVGIIAFIFAANISLAWWQKYAGKLLVISIVACAALAVFGMLQLPLAQCTYGACRWFNFGLINFQPAELLKFALLLFLAGFLGRKVTKGKINDFQETIVPVAVLVGVSILLIIGFQKDMGTGLALLGIVAAMLFVAGVNKRIGLGLLTSIIAVGILFVAIAPHRISRIVTFVGSDATTDLSGAAYHITQAKIALGTGGVFGLGLGRNVQSFGYLPEAPNDSIFAVMGEAFGFIGLIAILILLVALLLRLLRMLERIEDTSLRLIVAGVFGWLATHSLLNIGAIVGVVPLTGITLPLLSFGGTSLLFMMLALGLAFNISRYTVHGRIEGDNESPSKTNSYGRRGLSRPRNATNTRH